MAERKYDKYITYPERSQIKAEDDGRTVFDGLMVRHAQLGYNMTLGHQFVTKPFKNNNPAHTHNFQEFLAWYGGDPDDPMKFEAEVVLYMGEELEKYVFTRPTIVSIPEGLPHAPLEVTRVDSPIIQLEIMLIGEGGTREPYFK
ncbi:hypothetical protein ACFLUG_04645 [Chloroflexota bacterium]